MRKHQQEKEKKKSELMAKQRIVIQSKEQGIKSLEN